MVDGFLRINVTLENILPEVLPIGGKYYASRRLRAGSKGMNGPVFHTPDKESEKSSLSSGMYVVCGIWYIGCGIWSPVYGLVVGGWLLVVGC